jgi:hypothetical protein
MTRKPRWRSLGRYGDDGPWRVDLGDRSPFTIKLSDAGPSTLADR